MPILWITSLRKQILHQDPTFWFDWVVPKLLMLNVSSKRNRTLPQHTICVPTPNSISKITNSSKHKYLQTASWHPLQRSWHHGLSWAECSVQTPPVTVLSSAVGLLYDLKQKEDISRQCRFNLIYKLQQIDIYIYTLVTPSQPGRCYQGEYKLQQTPTELTII